MRTRATGSGRLRNRRGAVIVMVAITIVMLLGFTGVGVDGGRMYAFRAQMQRAADAAALAAITGVGVGDFAGAADTALRYVDRNRLMGNDVAVVPRDSVEPGTWNVDTRQFAPNGGAWNASVTAVRVKARYTANMTFMQVLGRATVPIRASSVAMRGYVGADDCIKPWAVSYQTLLDKLYPPNGTKPVSYDLTGTDVNSLKAMSYPANAVRLLSGTSDPITPGNVGQVVVGNPWTGNSPTQGYQGAIRNCANLSIGPGTWLDSDPGGGTGQTANALKDFCNANGGTSGNGQSFTCVAQPPVKLAMWDTNNGLSGSNLKYRVKYIGVFKVVEFIKGPGQNPDQIVGYFSTLAEGGAFSATPTPIIRPGGVIVE